ncbi:MAG TPA: LysR family transcriptional regulator [Clostridia bacterium]|nr:LysR family transcriptional regulator [Clostridia bacterium]
MNLELYKSFYYVAENASISKAAEQLYITQPAVSRAIRQLEYELGCALFTRTPRGVKLTQEGEVLYRSVAQVFSSLSAAERKISALRNLLAGEVKIGASDTLCKHYLVPYLKLFHTLHPGIRIQVICQTTPGIISLLKSGTIDFGMINMPYEDDDLVFKSILEIQDCFVAGEKYHYLCNKMQPLSEIAKQPLLLLEKASNSRTFIDRYFENNSITAEPAFELGNMDLLIHFARFDFGIACVIRNFITDELENGILREVKPFEKIPPRSIGAAWLKDIPLSAAAAELINVLGYNDESEI